MISIDKKTGEFLVTPFSKFRRETIGRDPGSMIIEHQDFSWSEENRDFIVVDTDKEDRQAYIDSFKDDCGVYNVLKKYAISGDASLLNARQAFYGDISDLPVDQLNPEKMKAAADTAVTKLSDQLGVDVTSDQLANMSIEEINSLIEKAVIAKTQKVSEVKKEGE